MKSWKSQCGDGGYRLQFETDDRKAYEIMEKCAQMIMDITPCQHAHWEFDGKDFECSRCHSLALKSDASTLQILSDYCPNCGAIMDEEVTSKQ